MPLPLPLPLRLRRGRSFASSQLLTLMRFAVNKRRQPIKVTVSVKCFQPKMFIPGS